MSKTKQAIDLEFKIAKYIIVLIVGVFIGTLFGAILGDKHIQDFKESHLCIPNDSIILEEECWNESVDTDLREQKYLINCTDSPFFEGDFINFRTYIYYKDRFKMPFLDWYEYGCLVKKIGDVEIVMKNETICKPKEIRECVEWEKEYDDCLLRVPKGDKESLSWCENQKVCKKYNYNFNVEVKNG